jgi:hypothetical protein
MAIKNKSARQGQFVPPGAEPGLTRKFMWRDIDGDKAVGDIARTRFDYPDIGNPNLQTFTNRPARQVGVRINMTDKDLLFPDIVILARPSDEVHLTAEIETQRSLRETPEEELAAKWRAFIGVGPFYLFVPLMQVDSARAMIKRQRLALAGLRSWRYITGQDIVDITAL